MPTATAKPCTAGSSRSRPSFLGGFIGCTRGRRLFHGQVVKETPMEPPEPPSAETPQTVWECCLVWGGVLIDVHANAREQSSPRPATWSEEETVLYTGVDRPLVSFLVAAALHERILHLNLSFPDAPLVPLAAPGEEGATGTLRRAAYTALELSPDSEGRDSSSRALLMRSALSSHPDERLLWERVRTTALTVVDGVSRVTHARHTGPRQPGARTDGPYWERGSTMGDVLLGEQRRRELERLADAWGDED